MTNNLDEKPVLPSDTKDVNGSWHLHALTEALGNLTLTVRDSLSIGRGNDNDVVLGSKEVSRNHALLSILNDKLYIKDLDSSNGTFINDERIENNKSKHLKADDKVGFASFAFQVTAPIVDTDTVIGSDGIDRTGTDSIEVNNMQTTNSEPEVVQDSVFANNDVVAMPIVAEQAIDPVIEQSEVATEKVEFARTIDEPELTAVMELAVDSPVEPIVAEETVLENSVSATAVYEQASENVVLDRQVEAPLVKETIIKDVLSSVGDNADVPVAASEPSVTTEKVISMSNDTYNDDEVPNEAAHETLDTEPMINEPLMKEPMMHTEPAVSPEHDKTTKTALQEESDPDVLRARQAATGQFSGTANLGAGRDLGTEGNNALDQAIDNPANAGQADKQPSGSWFIWVFIAIIIIGLALWLFNMGST